MLSVDRFEPSDLESIEVDYDFPLSQRSAFSRNDNIIAVTARDEGRIVAVGGVSIMWPGVGEGWIMVSKYAHETPLTVARYADSLFDVIIEEANLTRIQASVHSADPKAVRFARWMGFENEGLMKKYGPDGCDYYRMARIV